MNHDSPELFPKDFSRSEPDNARIISEENPQSDESRSRSRFLFLFSFLCVLAAVLIALAITRDRTETAVTDLLEIALRVSENAGVTEVIQSPEEARAYIRSEFGWRVGVPEIENFPLVGMSIIDLAPVVGVPAFIYENPDGRVMVLSLNYALLDDVPDRILLDPQDGEALVVGNPQVRRRDDGDVVLWRHRDDIFIAVPDFPAEELIGTITMNR